MTECATTSPPSLGYSLNGCVLKSTLTMSSVTTRVSEAHRTLPRQPVGLAFARPTLQRFWTAANQVSVVANLLSVYSERQTGAGASGDFRPGQRTTDYAAFD